MKAIDRPFTKIINGATQLVIPVFQWHYRWFTIPTRLLCRTTSPLSASSWAKSD
ncbi:MAG: hypothetical protein ACLQIB_37715 [Isosphaeraceae bacterium]